MMRAIRGPDMPSRSGGSSPLYGPPDEGVVDGRGEFVGLDQAVASDIRAS